MSEQVKQDEADIIAIKKHRANIDTVVRELRQAAPSREKSLSCTKLEEARMWLGMELRRLADGISCYAHAEDVTSAKVDPYKP